ncbi:MAG TPA: hypothetical protein VK530_19910, partial [Candidatus Acidoferrum sp.]|nr:hypothetical protein [Candidatus Acidoferrum sp.]
MRNNSPSRFVSGAMFNLLQRSPLIPLAIACAVMLLGVGCKKKSSDVAANSANETTLTGKPSDAPVPITPSWRSGKTYVLRLERTQSSELGGIGGGRRGGAQANNAPVESTYA